MTSTHNTDQPNSFYIISVTVLTFVLPVIGFVAEHFATTRAFTFEVFGKWFIFSAVGLRLFFAGIKQVKDPEFTAKQIFHIDSPDSFPILRELGFANMCFGLVGIVSLFKPEWRIVSAFASGLYYGIAGVQHSLKRTSGINEKFALWTDLIIFVLLAIYFYFALVISQSITCNNKTGKANNTMATTTDSSYKNGYSEVNGLNMYYEIHGEGKPLVLIHGGGSTIGTNFEKIIPLLAKNRKVIAMELQAHGRTSDRNADLTFEQDADDVAALLKNLNVDKADILGFSNGGTTTLQIAIRHPEIVNKMILGSALAKRSGVPDWFWGFMSQAKLENMPAQLKEGYKKVAPDANGLQVMHDRDAKRMVNFKDIPDDQITAIKVPTLIIIGDKDVITPEHALQLHRQIANSELAIIPGGHGEYIGEVTTVTPDFKESSLVVPMIEKFLDKKTTK